MNSINFCKFLWGFNINSRFSLLTFYFHWKTLRDIFYRLTSVSILRSEWTFLFYRTSLSVTFEKGYFVVFLNCLFKVNFGVWETFVTVRRRMWWLILPFDSEVSYYNPSLTVTLYTRLSSLSFRSNAPFQNWDRWRPRLKYLSDLMYSSYETHVGLWGHRYLPSVRTRMTCPLQHFQTVDWVHHQYPSLCEGWI